MAINWWSIFVACISKHKTCDLLWNTIRLLGLQWSYVVWSWILYHCPLFQMLFAWSINFSVLRVFRSHGHAPGLDWSGTHFRFPHSAQNICLDHLTFGHILACLSRFVKIRITISPRYVYVCEYSSGKSTLPIYHAIYFCTSLEPTSMLSQSTFLVHFGMEITSQKLFRIEYWSLQASKMTSTGLNFN